MKRALLGFLVLGMTAPLLARDGQVEITVARHSAGIPPVESRVLLSRKSSELLCQGTSVPEHAIQVPALKGLDAPFHNELATSSCPMVVTWGKTRACYQRHRFPLVDEVLNWCLNI